MPTYHKTGAQTQHSNSSLHPSPLPPSPLAHTARPSRPCPTNAPKQTPKTPPQWHLFEAVRLLDRRPNLIDAGHGDELRQLEGSLFYPSLPLQILALLAPVPRNGHRVAIRLEEQRTEVAQNRNARGGGPILFLLRRAHRPQGNFFLLKHA